MTGVHLITQGQYRLVLVTSRLPVSRCYHVLPLQVTLPSTLVFDYPTIDAITSLVASLQPQAGSATATGQHAPDGNEDDQPSDYESSTEDNDVEGDSDAYGAVDVVNAASRRSMGRPAAVGAAAGRPQRQLLVVLLSSAHTAPRGSTLGCISCKGLEDTVQPVPQSRSVRVHERKYMKPITAHGNRLARGMSYAFW